MYGLVKKTNLFVHLYILFINMVYEKYLLFIPYEYLNKLNILYSKTYCYSLSSFSIIIQDLSLEISLFSVLKRCLSLTQALLIATSLPFAFCSSDLALFHYRSTCLWRDSTMLCFCMQLPYVMWKVKVWRKRMDWKSHTACGTEHSKVQFNFFF